MPPSLKVPRIFAASSTSIVAYGRSRWRWYPTSFLTSPGSTTARLGGPCHFQAGMFANNPLARLLMIGLQEHRAVTAKY